MPGDRDDFQDYFTHTQGITSRNTPSWLFVLQGVPRLGLLLGSLLQHRVELGCGAQRVTRRGCNPSHAHFALFAWTNLTSESGGWTCQTCSGTRSGGTSLPSRSDLGPVPLSQFSVPGSTHSGQEFELDNFPVLGSNSSCAPYCLWDHLFRCSIHLSVNWFHHVFPGGLLGGKEITYVVNTPETCQKTFLAQPRCHSIWETPSLAMG